MIIFLIVLIWILIGLAGTCLLIAASARDFGMVTVTDITLSLAVSFGGPIALIFAIIFYFASMDKIIWREKDE